MEKERDKRKKEERQRKNETKAGVCVIINDYFTLIISLKLCLISHAFFLKVNSYIKKKKEEEEAF